MTQIKEQTISHCMNIYNNWIRNDLLEDKLKYSDKRLQVSNPQLGPLNIKYLRELIEDVKNNKPIIDLGDDGDLVLECIAEACHMGLDGWSTEESACIGAFLRDIGLAVRESKPTKYDRFIEVLNDMELTGYQRDHLCSLTDEYETTNKNREAAREETVLPVRETK